MKTIVMLLSIISIVCFSCTNHEKNTGSTNENSPKISHKINQKPVAQDILSNNQVDSLVFQIRASFNRTNKITKWTKIEKEFLEGTNEGGEAKLFYLNKELTKIGTDQMGETFRLTREYYLNNSGLFFVFERLEKYNKPFDRSNSTFYESRKYFYNGNLIKRLNSDVKENPLNDISIRDDKKVILEELKKLKKIKQTSL